jgi:predicted NUDIX family NTP pyrophosphohydrolase
LGHGLASLAGVAVLRSAGILLVRGGDLDGGGRDGELEVLLVHPGGPFFARRDDGAWSIPKGLYEPGEDARVAAAREFAEELGAPLPVGAEWDLGEVRLPSGKRLTVFAVRADFDPTRVESNTFELEWPPRSGRRQSFPEVDRAEWFDLDTARRKLAKGQALFLDRLLGALRPVPPG